MDAPVREVAGKVLGQGSPPLHQIGGGVVQGVEGAGVLLLPAELAQGAAPAHLLRRPVKDHRRVLLRGHRGAAAHAVIQVPQSGGQAGQLGPHPLQGGGELRGLGPLHPLAAEDPARQQQEQHRPCRRLRQQRCVEARRQGGHQRRAPKGQGRPDPPAAAAAPGQQPRQPVGRAEEDATGAGAEVRRQARPQPGGGPCHGAPLIGGVGQQQAQQDPPDGQARQLHIHQRQQDGAHQEQQAVRLQPFLLCLQQGLVIPGGEPHQHRPRQAGAQVPQGGQGLEHVDAADRQEQPRPRQGVEPRPVQQLQPLEGRGGGEDQDGGGQKGQGRGKVQKQPRPHPGPQQGGDALRTRAAGGHAPQGEGGVVPRRLAGGQRRCQKKTDPPGQGPGCLLPASDQLPVFHSLSLLYSAAKFTASLVFATILQPSGKKSRREKQAAHFLNRAVRRTGGGGLFAGNVIS